MARTHLQRPAAAEEAFAAPARSISVKAVRMASNSTKKPAATSSHGHESIQGSEGASTLQNAEIALSALNFSFGMYVVRIVFMIFGEMLSLSYSFRRGMKPLSPIIFWEGAQ